jgi:hypothetical protein
MNSKRTASALAWPFAPEIVTVPLTPAVKL